LSLGLNTLTVIYTPDSASAPTYSNTSSSISIGNLQSVLIVPSVQVTSNGSTLTTADTLSVQVFVNSGTGTVTLTSGSYTSAAVTLVNSFATISVPPGSLAIGTDTLTATYTPDAASTPIYASATGTETVTVTAPPPPSFAVAGTSVVIAPGATTLNTSTITLTPSNGFTGSVVLTAAITSSPTGAQDLPTFSFGTTSPVSINGTSAVTATLTIATTASSAAALVFPQRPMSRRGGPWYATGGAALACLILFGVPRRRRWRSFFGMIVLLAGISAGIASCGGGGSGGGGGGGGGNPGTTSGSYTITVTGTSGTTTETGKVIVNVD